VDLTSFFYGLKQVSASPLALVGYVVVVGAWTLRTWLLVRPQRQARRILGLFKTDSERVTALRALLGAEPPRGLSGPQTLEWARIQAGSNSRLLLLIAYVVTLITACLIIGLTVQTARSIDADLPPKLIDSKASRP
jgi:hypothetical protein